MELDYIESVELINKLREKETEEKLWDKWLSLYPYMEMKWVDNMSFEEYKRRILGSYSNNEKQLTEKEVYEDVDNIIRSFKKERPQKEGE